MKSHGISILIGVLATIIAVILIALFSGYVKSIKQEIVGQVSDKIVEESKSIRLEIGKERRSRCELAAVLARSGMDIPTHLIVAFSSADTDKELLKTFSAELKTALKQLHAEKEYSEYMANMRAYGDIHPAIAHLEANRYLLAVSRSEPKYENAKVSNDYVDLKLMTDENTHKKISIKAAVYKSLIDLLKNPEMKTCALRTVEVEGIRSAQAPNE